MDIILGALILGILIVIAVLQIKGKPLQIHIITTQKIDIAPEVKQAINIDQLNETNAKKALDEVVSTVQSIMTGGERNGNEN